MLGTWTHLHLFQRSNTFAALLWKPQKWKAEWSRGQTKLRHRSRRHEHCGSFSTGGCSRQENSNYAWLCVKGFPGAKSDAGEKCIPSSSLLLIRKWPSPRPEPVGRSCLRLTPTLTNGSPKCWPWNHPSSFTHWSQSRCAVAADEVAKRQEKEAMEFGRTLCE